MLKQVYYFVALFFALLAILSLWLGNFFLISLPTAVLALIAALYLSYWIEKKEGIKPDSLKDYIPVIAIAIFLFLFLIVTLGSNLVYPFTCSDFMNHVSVSRVISNMGGVSPERFTYLDDYSFELLPFMHDYPMHLRSSIALLYNIFPDAYILSSIIPILLLAVSVFGVFFIARRYLNRKYAIIASFIYAFVITNFLLLDSGYLNQLFGQFFFFAAFLALLEKRKYAFPIFLSATIAFPPYFLILSLLLAIKAFKEKQLSYIYPAIIAILLIFPEAIGLFFDRIVREDLLRGFALLQGGISIPNLFNLVIAVPILLGVYYFFKQHKKNSDLNYLFISTFLASFVLVLLFLLNPSVIYRLYMPIKISYLLFALASIYAAAGLMFIETHLPKNIAKVIIIAILLFHALYFIGYYTEVQNKISFDSGFYPATEFLHTLEPGFTLGVDQCMMDIPPFEKPIPLYASLYDKPDPYSKNFCRYLELGQAFEFPGTKQKNLDTTLGSEIIDSFGNQVVIRGSQDTDLFITDCSVLDKPVIFESGNTKIYDLRG